ncbi:hypothetical protein ACIOHE_26475 [Streptomyces sp. NPDC087851]|uniref:hypothetical protein n=1 Tax=Streptomyces sp. NPDC087851 TaxID=3365810 RepID=UPI0037F399F6
MKATKSIDGLYRIDVLVTFRVGVGELVTALCSAYRFHTTEDDGPLPRLSKAAVNKKIREEFYLRGGSDGLSGWADCQSDDETRERVTWAEEHVRRAFPELATEAPAKTPTDDAPQACVHGNTPRPDVTGDPITECRATPGVEDFGAFNDEGCFYSYGCAVDVANKAAKESEESDHITWSKICAAHAEQPAATCEECNADGSA